MRACLLVPALVATLAAGEPLALTAPIRSVRVHPDEAWVTRVGNLTLTTAGAFKVKLGQLPGGLVLDDLRIQAKGPGGARLGEILVGPDRHVAPETKESKALLGRLEALHMKKSELEAQQEANQKAAGFLEGFMNQQRSGDGKALPTGSALIELTRGLEARISELSAQAQTRGRELEKVQKEMSTLEADWQKLRGKLDTNPNPSAVTVELDTDQPGEVELEVSYRTRQARWKPSYESRLSLDGKRLELVLFAAVTQASGESWDHLRMELSNSTPSKVQEMPSFHHISNLGWKAPLVSFPSGNMAGATVEVFASSATVDATSVTTGVNYSRDSIRAYYPPVQKPLPVLEPAASTLEESSGLAKTWLLEGSKDVPSDGDAHRFRVAVQELVPSLHVVVAPRLDTTAYQVVRFPAPTNVPLFPGAPILRYVGSQRIGQGDFTIPAAGQPFELNYGPYQGLRTSFQRVGEKRPFKMSKIVGVLTRAGGVTKTETREEITTANPERVWQLEERITLANDTAGPLTVEVQDRVVRSVHESVRIGPTATTTPGAVLKGTLVQAWTVRLDSKSEASVDTGLVIKAPKEGELTGLRELGLE
ncbi:MAG: mucoidy inhibitor MuiA family protein [Holophagaceae bacterium]|nr:mucoidy inhibitor MuiA family protein [Holophagaceae bacterium]